MRNCDIHDGPRGCHPEGDAGARLLRPRDERSRRGPRLPAACAFRDCGGQRDGVPPSCRFSQREGGRRPQHPARVRDLRTPRGRGRARTASRSARTGRDDAPHGARATGPDPAGGDERDHRAFGARRRDELRRRRAPPEGPRREPLEDRRHSAWHSRAAGRAQQGEGRRRGQRRHPHLRAALAGQGDRERDRCDARDPREASQRNLHRAGCDAPARQAGARRVVPPDAAAARGAARSRRERHLPQPLREPRRGGRVPRRRGHLRDAVPQGRTEHLGYPRLRGRLREGDHLDAVPLRPRASRRGPRGPRSHARLGGDRARGDRALRRPGRTCGPPAARRGVRTVDELAERGASLCRVLHARPRGLHEPGPRRERGANAREAPTPSCPRSI